jgi:UDP-glucuronate 4-epimerase
VARIYNIGNNKPEELTRVVAILEQELGRKAERQLLPMQPGDVPATYADIDDLARDVDFRPATAIEDGTVNLRRGIEAIIICKRRLTDP